MENKFFIGTTNPYKVREIGAILAATGCTYEVTDPVNPEETENNFEGNAVLKALVYAKHAGGMTISEDSGLLIPSLHNLPGPWSARFYDCEFDYENGILLNEHDSDKQRDEIDLLNNQKVLDLMSDYELPHRAALFKVVMVVADECSNVLFKGVSEAHGWISQEMRGSNGFGYDPIFIGNDTFGKTYAELDSHRKNLKSHRRKVLQEFKVWLGEFLKGRS